MALAKVAMLPKNRNSLEALNTNTQTLFNFLVLITDIQYRIKYGRSLEWDRGKGYSKDMNSSFPDQIPSVDNGLESVAQRRISDEL